MKASVFLGVCAASFLWVCARAADVSAPGVGRIVTGVKTTDLVNTVRQLSGEDRMLVAGSPFALTNRSTASTVCIGKATQFVHDELQALGLSVSYQNFSGVGVTGRNVIAVQPGGALSNELVYVTAHLDDMPDYGLSPGADDNASGSAAVLLAARLFSQQRFARTVKFALFTGEEQNLSGSTQTALQASRAGEHIVAVVNIDMMAWASLVPPIGTVRIRPVSDPFFSNDLALASVFTNVATAYGLTNSFVPTILADGQRSDQSSFWRYGWPGIFVFEDGPSPGDFNPHYHTSSDTLAYLNVDYYTAMTQAGLGTAAALAQPSGEAPFEAIEVVSSSWGPGSALGAGAFYARHDLDATDSGADARDVPWANATAPTNKLWFKAVSQPYGTELQTDARPWTNEAVISGNLVFMNQTASPASSSNAVRFRFISPPVSNRVYAVRVRLDGHYTTNGVGFEALTNLQQLVAAGHGLLPLPTLTNLTNGAVYGTFDIAARFADTTTGFAVRVDSLEGQTLTLSTPAQVGAVLTDIYEMSTNLGPDAVWLPVSATKNYVGAANSAEFDAGWTRVNAQFDVSTWSGAFMRLRRGWN